MEEKLRLIISDHPFFKDISQSNRLISDVVKNSKIRKIDQYRIIIQQDEPANHLIFILTGSVSIFVKKQKMEIDYERELRLHFEEIKNKYEHTLQFESENKAVLKKAEMKLKNAFKLVDRSERQYDDPIYRSAFPNFENEYMTNRFTIFPYKRVLTINEGQIIGCESSNNPSQQNKNNYIQDRLNNLTAVSSTKVVYAAIPIDYLSSIMPIKKLDIIQNAFQQYFGGIINKDIQIISQFFEKQIYEMNVTIFKNKENTDKIYVIGKGEVELSININNSQHRLMLLLENDIFGHENFSIDKAYRATSLSNDTQIYCIEKQLFFELIENKINFSTISQIGDEKLKRSFSFLQSNISIMQPQTTTNQNQIKIKSDKDNNHEQQLDNIELSKKSNLKSQKQTLSNFNKENSNNLQQDEHYLKSDFNSSIIINQNKSRSNTQNNNSSDSRDNNKNKRFKTLPDRSPYRNQNQFDEQLQEQDSLNNITLDKIQIQEKNIDQLYNKNNEKYQKYYYGFADSSNKKKNVTLPYISSNHSQIIEEKKTRQKSPLSKNLIVQIDEGILFQNDKLKQTTNLVDEILYLHQNNNITTQSFESKDTQILFQKNLALHKSIQNDLDKNPSSTIIKNNIAFLQDLSQQDNFKEIQEKVKQNIFRKNNKSPSPLKTKLRDGAEMIIHTKLKKIKSHHHSIEDITQGQQINTTLLNKKNYQTLQPLDVLFRKEREKQKKNEQIQKEYQDNQEQKNQLKEINLNITDQMRSITPLQSIIKDNNNNINKQESTLKNSVLRNISIINKNENDLDKSILVNQIQDNNNNSSITIQHYETENNSCLNTSQNKQQNNSIPNYHLIKLNKKKQLNKSTNNNNDENCQLNEEEQNINNNSCIYLSPTVTNFKDIINKQNNNNTNKNQSKDNTIQNNNNTIEKNKSILINPQDKQQQQQQTINIEQSLIINGEQKLIKDKNQQQLQPLQQTLKKIRPQMNSNNQTIIIQNKHSKKSSEPLISKTQPASMLEQIILFEQNSSSQILTNQTLPIMDKVHLPSSTMMINQQQQQKKIRSMTIEDKQTKIGSNNNNYINKLNVTEILEIPNKSLKTYSSHINQNQCKLDKSYYNLNTENSSSDQQATNIINQEHQVIHQNKKKFNKLTDILKHKAYIQKKLKRQFIRSPQLNNRLEIEQFNKDLQIYSENYNTNNNLSGFKQQQQQFHNTSSFITSINNLEDKEIFSLSSPIKLQQKSKIINLQEVQQSNTNKQNKTLEFTSPIKQIYEQEQQQQKEIQQNEGILQNVNNNQLNLMNQTYSSNRMNQISPNNFATTLNNINKNTLQYSNKTLLNQTFSSSKSNNRFNKQQQQSDLEQSSKISNKSKKSSLNKLRSTSTIDNHQLQNNQYQSYLQQEITIPELQINGISNIDMDLSIKKYSQQSKRTQQQLQRSQSKISSDNNNNYSHSSSNNLNNNDKIENEQNNNNSKQKLMRDENNNSDCSFAFGSPIKSSISQRLAYEQNKLLSLNRDPKSLINSFYLQANSSYHNNNNHNDSQYLLNNNNHNSSLGFNINNNNNNFSDLMQHQQRLQDNSSKLSNYNNNNNNNQKIINNDLSHLNIIKQLDFKRQNDVQFSFQSPSSPMNQ